MADGNTTPKKKSLFDTVTEQWIADHGGSAQKAKEWKPDPKSVTAFKEKIVKARASVAEAEKLLDDTKKAQDEAEAEAIRFFGPHNIKLPGGQVLAPTCRGERLFYHDASDAPL